MSTNTNNLQPIRGGPFQITLLNRIFSFATEEASEGILTYGLVCKQWRECQLFYSQDMWKLLSERKFGKKIKGYRWSYYSYMKKAKSLFHVTLRSPEPGKRRQARIYAANHFFDEIENCATQDEAVAEINNNSGGDSKTAHFRFRCPMIAANLKVLEDEVVPYTNRNVLYCNVCEMKVYPFVNKEEADQIRSHLATKGEEVPRCVRITGQTDKEMKEINEAAKAKQSRNADKNSGDITDYTAGLFNVAIVTTEPEPEDAFEGIAERVLALLYNEFPVMYSTAKQNIIYTDAVRDDAYSDFDEDDKKEIQARDDLVGKQKDVTVNNVEAPLFISKDIVSFNCFENGNRIVARIVRIPEVPKDLAAAETMHEKRAAAFKYNFNSSLHPCLDDGPLGRNNMPAQNGWNYVVLCTPSAERWFEDDILPKKTPAGALKAACRVISLPHNLEYKLREKRPFHRSFRGLEEFKAKLFPYLSASSSSSASSVTVNDDNSSKKKDKVGLSALFEDDDEQHQITESLYNKKIEQTLVVPIVDAANEHFYPIDEMGEEYYSEDED